MLRWYSCIDRYLRNKFFELLICHRINHSALASFVFIFEYSYSLSYRRCRHLMITCNHNRSYSCVYTFWNRIRRLVSRRVHHSCKAYKYQLIFIFIWQFSAFIKSLKGKGKHPQSVLWKASVGLLYIISVPLRYFTNNAVFLNCRNSI